MSRKNIPEKIVEEIFSERKNNGAALQFGYIQIAVSEVCFDAGVWRSWGDALSKQSCELFVAKAHECPYGTRAGAPWALPVYNL